MARAETQLQQELANPSGYVLPNNFDLVRLFAAAQVLFFHFSVHLHVQFGPVGRVLANIWSFFPGVPVFFVVSGFLVSLSYERSPSVKQYARNRLLRIYPALWVSFVVSLILIFAAQAVSWHVLRSRSFWAWVIAQLSFAQFYNPDFLRGFGIGVLNGSLWTIPVELSFYFAVPIIYAALKRLSLRMARIAIAVVAAFSFLIWFAYARGDSAGESLNLKLLRVSLLPHLHLFLIGMLFRQIRLHSARWINDKAVAWTVLYVAWMLSANVLVVRDARLLEAVWTAVGRLLLAVSTVSWAFSYRTASDHLLRGNDISYGLYIYHCLVLNLIVAFDHSERSLSLLLGILVSCLLGVASWKLIERPALRLKRRALRVPYSNGTRPSVVR